MHTACTALRANLETLPNALYMMQAGNVESECAAPAAQLVMDMVAAAMAAGLLEPLWGPIEYAVSVQTKPVISLGTFPTHLGALVCRLVSFRLQ